MKRIGKLLLVLGAALLIALAAFVLFAVLTTAGTRLEPEKLHLCEASVRLLDRTGDEIETPRERVAWDELPPHLPAAFVAVEDKRFYDHGGLDVLRIGKAALKNLFSL